MRTKRLPRTADYRAVLQARGDVALGAYARAQRRRRIITGLFGVGLILGAVGLFVFLLPSDKPLGNSGVPVVVRCAACQREGLVHLPRGEVRFPVNCPHCGRAAYRLWECRRCSERFVPTADAELVCPSCGSTQLGVAEKPRARPISEDSSGAETEE